MRLWRISQYPGLDGTGGTFVDGRWHTRPRNVLYTSEHPALAMVEILAHMHLAAATMPIGLRLLAIDVRKGAKVSPAPALPSGWQANEATSQTLGNAWLDARDALLIKLPSAILAESFNYLVNPAHRQAASHLVESDLGPFWVDPRFIR